MMEETSSSTGSGNSGSGTTSSGTASMTTTTTTTTFRHLEVRDHGHDVPGKSTATTLRLPPSSMMQLTATTIAASFHPTLPIDRESMPALTAALTHPHLRVLRLDIQAAARTRLVCSMDVNLPALDTLVWFGTGTHDARLLGWTPESGLAPPVLTDEVVADPRVGGVVLDPAEKGRNVAWVECVDALLFSGSSSPRGGGAMLRNLRVVQLNPPCTASTNSTMDIFLASVVLKDRKRVEALETLSLQGWSKDLDSWDRVSLRVDHARGLPNLCRLRVDVSRHDLARERVENSVGRFVKLHTLSIGTTRDANEDADAVATELATRLTAVLPQLRYIKIQTYLHPLNATATNLFVVDTDPATGRRAPVAKTAEHDIMASFADVWFFAEAGSLADLSPTWGIPDAVFQPPPTIITPSSDPWRSDGDDATTTTVRTEPSTTTRVDGDRARARRLHRAVSFFRNIDMVDRKNFQHLQVRDFTLGSTLDPALSRTVVCATFDPTLPTTPETAPGVAAIFNHGTLQILRLDVQARGRELITRHMDVRLPSLHTLVWFGAGRHDTSAMGWTPESGTPPPVLPNEDGNTWIQCLKTIMLCTKRLLHIRITQLNPPCERGAKTTMDDFLGEVVGASSRDVRRRLECVESLHLQGWNSEICGWDVVHVRGLHGFLPSLVRLRIDLPTDDLVDIEGVFRGFELLRLLSVGITRPPTTDPEAFSTSVADRLTRTLPALHILKIHSYVSAGVELHTAFFVIDRREAGGGRVAVRVTEQVVAGLRGAWFFDEVGSLGDLDPMMGMDEFKYSEEEEESVDGAFRAEKESVVSPNVTDSSGGESLLVKVEESRMPVPPPRDPSINRDRKRVTTAPIQSPDSAIALPLSDDEPRVATKVTVVVPPTITISTEDSPRDTTTRARELRSVASAAALDPTPRVTQRKVSDPGHQKTTVPKPRDPAAEKDFKMRELAGSEFFKQVAVIDHVPGSGFPTPRLGRDVVCATFDPALPTHPDAIPGLTAVLTHHALQILRLDIQAEGRRTLVRSLLMNLPMLHTLVWFGTGRHDAMALGWRPTGADATPPVLDASGDRNHWVRCVKAVITSTPRIRHIRVTQINPPCDKSLGTSLNDLVDALVHCSDVTRRRIEGLESLHLQGWGVGDSWDRVLLRGKTAKGLAGNLPQLRRLRIDVASDDIETLHEILEPFAMLTTLWIGVSIDSPVADGFALALTTKLAERLAALRNVKVQRIDDELLETATAMHFIIETDRRTRAKTVKRVTEDEARGVWFFKEAGRLQDLSPVHGMDVKDAPAGKIGGASVTVSNEKLSSFVKAIDSNATITPQAATAISVPLSGAGIERQRTVAMSRAKTVVAMTKASDGMDGDVAAAESFVGAVDRLEVRDGAKAAKPVAPERNSSRQRSVSAAPSFRTPKESDNVAVTPAQDDSFTMFLPPIVDGTAAPFSQPQRVKTHTVRDPLKFRPTTTTTTVKTLPQQRTLDVGLSSKMAIDFAALRAAPFEGIATGKPHMEPSDIMDSYFNDHHDVLTQHQDRVFHAVNGQAAIHYQATDAAIALALANIEIAPTPPVEEFDFGADIEIPPTPVEEFDFGADIEIPPTPVQEYGFSYGFPMSGGDHHHYLTDAAIASALQHDDYELAFRNYGRGGSAAVPEEEELKGGGKVGGLLKMFGIGKKKSAVWKDRK